MNTIDYDDVSPIRADFPILETRVNGHSLVYLDNAATTQKPRFVLEAMDRYYNHQNANIHRGVHHLSQVATSEYEAARRNVARHIGAADPSEIVFTRGTTESINLVAWSFLRPQLRAGDRVVISWLEHHSNIVPWQLVCDDVGAELCAVPVQDNGMLDMDAYEQLLTSNVRLVAVTHVSNAIGAVNPVADIVRIAHARNIPVLLDGAQAVQHLEVDVSVLGCEFYAFSGHKLYGPTGIGVLYGRRDVLERMRPYQGGGDMIRSVTFAHTTYADIPARFEAGTPNIAGAIGLSAAIDYVRHIGIDRIRLHEADLLTYATDRLRGVPNLRIVGESPRRAAVISFVIDGYHPHDIGTIVDSRGVAIRTGHHCAQPLMQRLRVDGTARASFAMYNSRADIDALVDALAEIGLLDGQPSEEVAHGTQCR
jgi:cysteine desulfurase/selenocysteine lyase